MTPPSTLPLAVGILLFPGFELLDAYGPMELFGAMHGASLSTIAEKTGIVQSAQGPKSIADFSWETPPALDVLLVPGGQGTRQEIGNPKLLSALCAMAAGTRIVASVCTGSALLAKAGLLDGKRATSNKQVFAWARSQGPAVRWIEKARWVEDGKFFTSSGVSAGMDMTLAIIAHLSGKNESLRVARYAEYCWNENPDNDPFSP